MKETTNYGLPYPECNPPLVKDAADLPRNLHDLAIEAESEFARAVDIVELAAQLTPAADIRTTGQQTIRTGFTIALPHVSLKQGDIDVDVPSEIRITAAGLYAIVGHATTTTGTGAWARLNISVNNQVGRSSSVRPPAAGMRNNVFYMRVLLVGDVVTLTQSSPTDLTYIEARMSMVRIMSL